MGNARWSGVSVEEAAAAAGATPLGKEGPDGAHWLFSREELGRFVALVRGVPNSGQIVPKMLPPLPY